MMNHSIRRTLAAAVASLSLSICSTTFGAAEPTPPAWTSTVDRLADGLGSAAGVDVSPFGERAAFRTFDGRDAAVDDLARLLSGANWVQSLSYPRGPETLASDLAAALNDAPVPEASKRFFTPAGEIAMQQANATAMRWVAKQLKTRVDQPVGVVLFHIPEPSGAGKLAIVLVAGERAGGDNYQFRQVTFGAFPATGAP